MKDKITFKIGDNIITNQNIMGSTHWVEVAKNHKGKIIKQYSDLAGSKRWLIKFNRVKDLIIVFENEINLQ